MLQRGVQIDHVIQLSFESTLFSLCSVLVSLVIHGHGNGNENWRGFFDEKPCRYAGVIKQGYTGRWDDVEKVRKMMRKMLRCSWNEVKEELQSHHRAEMKNVVEKSKEVLSASYMPYRIGGTSLLENMLRWGRLREVDVTEVASNNDVEVANKVSEQKVPPGRTQRSQWLETRNLQRVVLVIMSNATFELWLLKGIRRRWRIEERTTVKKYASSRAG
eukprot:Gb_14721 [translate_table: standard]